MENTQINPWLDDRRSLGSTANILRLAERTGHWRACVFGCRRFRTVGGSVQGGYVPSFGGYVPLKKRSEDSSDLTRTIHQCPSLRMFKHLREIDEQRREQKMNELEIQRRLQHKETKDITDPEILESRIDKANKLTSHLQDVISHKDLLVTRLQHPFAGDYLKLEATYHKYACDVLPQAAKVLAELSSQLDNIEWAASSELDSDQMNEILSEISSQLARIQTEFQSMVNFRQVLHSLQDSDR